MPKQETRCALAKRFEGTGNGGLKRHHALTGHRFHGKTRRQRCHLRKTAIVSRSSLKCIRQMFSRIRQ